jgi:hypothetical protein
MKLLIRNSVKIAKLAIFMIIKHLTCFIHKPQIYQNF